MQRGTRKPGFTLVELLVVIGIIAILIGILLPALNRARMQAKSVACQANLRSIGQAIGIYVVNSKGVLPIGDWDGNTYTPVPNASVITNPPGINIGDRATRWPLLLQGTLTKYGSSFNESATGGGDVSKIRELFRCPEAPGEETRIAGQSSTTLTYQCHPYLMPSINWGSTTNGQETLPTTPPSLARPYRMGKIKRSSEMALVFDCALAFEKVTVSGKDYYIWHPRFEGAVAGWIDNGGRWRPPYMWDDFNSTTANPNDSIDMTPGTIPGTGAFLLAKTNKDELTNALTIRFRHIRDTVSNVLMVDGHVESFTFDPRKAPTDKAVTNFKRKNLYVNRP